ncbi:LpqN/LpqT family lipoprotein, partial [Mycolicibacterium pyrenivorans]|uniref:LpqN/LpqT family lipoprotein n=1 Tax=Mycolicibacterium pyrenivorans TaxID=187102 RepID=UPI0021F3A176
MRTSAITGLVAAATALSVVLAGCDSGKDASASTTGPDAAAPTAAATGPDAAGSKASDGPNPTIASYIKDHKITEQQVHRTDTGEPKVELPKPDGWKS